MQNIALRRIKKDQVLFREIDFLIFVREKNYSETIKDLKEEFVGLLIRKRK